MRRDYFFFFLLVWVVFYLSGCTDEAAGSWRDDFELHPDFEIECVASEPEVLDPVDLVFSESGSLYVLEMPGYPLGMDQSVIVRLEDHDGDGAYESRTIFARELRQASSFMRWKGGFLVACPPYLVFLQDTDADGQADIRDTLMAGFSDGNLQHNFNGLTYALDNWVYGANGGNRGEVYWTDNPDRVTSLGYRDFRMHVPTRSFESIGRSTGGFELAINDWGHYFGTHNLYHVRQLVYPDRYAGDQGLIPSHAVYQVSDHEEDGLARIFAIGEQETRVNHPEQSGYFSGACGIEHYSADLFPGDFQGNIFVADVVLNLIHRDRLAIDGTTYRASRAREGVEFLASSDRTFRPVNIKTGPDGALYIVDMRREVIEHPEWIPDDLEANMDLAAGKDQGRIYRIFPRGKRDQSPCIFDTEDLPALIAGLDTDNQVCRLTAQRLLVDLADPSAEAALRASLSQFGPKGRMHALWTLQGLSKLSAEDLRRALEDEHPRVREQALILAETVHPVDLQGIVALIDDADPRVRMQALLSLGYCTREQASLASPNIPGILRTIAGEGDPYLILAAATACNPAPDEALLAILGAKAQHSLDLVRMVAMRIGQTSPLSSLRSLLRANAFRHASEPLLAATIEGLSEGLGLRDLTPNQVSSDVRSGLTAVEGRGTDTDLAVWKLRDRLGGSPSVYQRQRIDQALREVGQGALPDETRLEYIAILGHAQAEEAVPVLMALLDPKESAEIQTSAIAEIAQIRSPLVAPALIGAWSGFGPAVRRTASDILIYREENHGPLLTALEEGKATLGEFGFDLERRRQLLFSDDEEIRQRAEALFKDSGVVTRAEALEEMRPALQLAASVSAGEKIFDMQCAQCHQYKLKGNEVGPNLTECSRMSKETLLHHILDPNAVAEPSYLNHYVELTDGITLSGILESETSDAIQVRVLGGLTKVVPRSDIRSIRTNGLSFMPEGLEELISPQEMADLLAFLQGG